MNWSDEDERRVGMALRDAREAMVARGDKPSGAAIIFAIMRKVMDIHRRMNVGGHGTKKKSAWLLPITHDDLSLEDREDIAKQRMIDIQAGDPLEVVFGFMLSTTPAEIALHDAIVAIFRQCLVGKKQTRDWRMLQLMASGKPSARTAKQFHMSRQAVEDRKKLQCAAIWGRVKHLMTKESIVLRPADERANIEDDPVLTDMRHADRVWRQYDGSAA